MHAASPRIELPSKLMLCCCVGTEARLAPPRGPCLALCVPWISWTDSMLFFVVFFRLLFLFFVFFCCFFSSPDFFCCQFLASSDPGTGQTCLSNIPARVCTKFGCSFLLVCLRNIKRLLCVSSRACKEGRGLWWHDKSIGTPHAQPTCCGPAWLRLPWAFVRLALQNRQAEYSSM